MITFNHFNFNVLDLDKSLAFYRDALDLKVVRENHKEAFSPVSYTHLRPVKPYSAPDCRASAVLSAMADFGVSKVKLLSALVRLMSASSEVWRCV